MGDADAFKGRRNAIVFGKIKKFDTVCVANEKIESAFQLKSQKKERQNCPNFSQFCL